jgi:UDPglucose 6-dehydrogenase
VSFLRDVDEINLRRRARTIELGLDLLDGSYRGTRVAVLGAAFKPDSDDVRDSPALEVAAGVGRRGATVRVYDPEANASARRLHPELFYAVSLEEAVEQADLVMLLTEWSIFQAMDPEAIGRRVAQRNVVDGRNVLDPLRWRAAGWTYRSLGRP